MLNCSKDGIRDKRVNMLNRFEQIPHKHIVISLCFSWKRKEMRNTIAGVAHTS